MLSHLSRSVSRARERAFTLIELIIVLVILAVIALLALGTWTSVDHAARKRTLDATLKAVVRDANALAAQKQTGNSTVDPGTQLATAVGELPGSLTTAIDSANPPRWVTVTDSQSICRKITISGNVGDSGSVGDCDAAPVAGGPIRPATAVGTLTGSSVGVTAATGTTLTVDGTGSVYYTSSASPTKVIKLDPTTGATTVYNNGVGVALGAQAGLAVAADGTVYVVATPSLTQVFKFTPTSESVVATVPNAGVAQGANALALGADGMLYVVKSNGQLFQVNPSNGATSAACTVTAAATLVGVALDSDGTAYVADATNDVIRKVTNPASGAGCSSTVFAGTAGAAGATNGTGSAARFAYLQGLAIDRSSHTLYVAEGGANPVGSAFAGGNFAIRAVTVPGAVVSTAAGQLGVNPSVYQRDWVDGPVASAVLRSPAGLAVDGSGNVFFNDNGNTVREVVGGTVRSVTNPLARVDGPLASTEIDAPNGLAGAPNGDVYLIDHSGVRLLSAAGVSSTIKLYDGTSLGSPVAGVPQDPQSSYNKLTLLPNGNLAVADTWANKVRVVTPAGAVSDLATVSYATGIAHDSAGNIYVASAAGTGPLYKVAPGGAMTTIVASDARINNGTGLAVNATGTTGWLATDSANLLKVNLGTGAVTVLSSAFTDVVDVVLAPDGTVYAADAATSTVSQLDASTGAVLRTFGSASSPTSVDGTAAAGRLQAPESLGLSDDGTLLYVGEAYSGRVRAIKLN